MTHVSLTVRTPGGPTEHRPLREAERHEWLSTLEPRLTSDEHTRLLEKLHTLAIQVDRPDHPTGTLPDGRSVHVICGRW